MPDSSLLVEPFTAPDSCAMCGHSAANHHGENVYVAPGPCHATVYTNVCSGETGGVNATRCRCDKYLPDVPDSCHCPGYPCDHVPPPIIKTIDRVGYKMGYSRPVTMAMADELDRAGLWNVADLARKYAVDRPRWWHRFTRRGE